MLVVIITILRTTANLRRSRWCPTWPAGSPALSLHPQKQMSIFVRKPLTCASIITRDGQYTHLYIFNNRPASSAALLLAFYDFCNSNTYFITVFLRVCSQHQTSVDKTHEQAAPLASLLSFASYLFMHNRNERAFIYARIILITLLCLLEDQSLVNYMAKEDTVTVVRLCRQHPTPLPRIRKPRSLFCAYLDVLLLFIKHCMKRKLDLVSYK